MWQRLVDEYDAEVGESTVRRYVGEAAVANRRCYGRWWRLSRIRWAAKLTSIPATSVSISMIC